jgi:transcriptional regulator with XRE-family HTH domain
MAFDAPDQAPSADELVRRALEDLAIAYDRGDSRGVSRAEMARAIGVSHQQMSRILRGERYLHPGQIAHLPQRAYDAAMTAIVAARRAHRAPAGRSPESRCRQLTSLVGSHAALIERAYADGHLDGLEAAELRASLRDIEAAAGAGSDDLTTHARGTA